MKKIIRIVSLALIISCLLLPFVALAAFAQDMSISVQWTDASGAVQWSGPAVPVTDAPEETRFWITLPPEAPLTGLTLNISDLSGGIAYFEPGQDTVLEYVTDAMDSLDQPSVTIFGYNAEGELQAVYSLYISYQQLPQSPVNVPATVTIHYVDEYGSPLLRDMIYTFDIGLHQVSAPAIDQYMPAGSILYIVTVDNSGAVPAEITFTYTRFISPAAVAGHYADEYDQSLQLVNSIPWICPNCNKERTSNFCPDCGEKRPVTTHSNTPKPSSTTALTNVITNRNQNGINAIQSLTLGEKNALAQAKRYLEIMPFSRSGLIEQLEYEGFTHSQAVYGVINNGY